MIKQLSLFFFVLLLFPNYGFSTRYQCTIKKEYHLGHSGVFKELTQKDQTFYVDRTKGTMMGFLRTGMNSEVTILNHGEGGMEFSSLTNNHDIFKYLYIETSTGNKKKPFFYTLMSKVYTGYCLEQ